MFMDKAKEAAAEVSSVKELFVLGESAGVTPIASLMGADGEVNAMS